jgi:hypothetical protein
VSGMIVEDQRSLHPGCCERPSGRAVSSSAELGRPWVTKTHTL